MWHGRSAVTVARRPSCGLISNEEDGLNTPETPVHDAASRNSHRPEIALAWHRAQISGLDPGMEVREVPIAEVDRRGRLVTAAAPVLEAMMAELADTRFSVLLADRNATIVDRRMGRHSVGRELDRALAIPGVRYVEDVSGTNSL